VDISLTQADAMALLTIEKRRADEEEREYPALGGAITAPLVSTNGRENFLLDITRGRINLLKGTYQTRGRQVVVLARLDFAGPPHRNPDGEEIGSPHLHIYREGFGDKWALPAPADKFPNLSDPWKTLEDFLRFCNVTEAPKFRRGLFN